MNTPIKMALWLLIFAMLVCLSLALFGCSSPTAPAPNPVFPFVDCHVVNFGWEHKEGSPFFVTSVWQDWVCANGHNWRVYSDARGVVPLTPGTL